MELTCAVQSYSWGKLGGSSEVASLRSFADPSFVVDPALPYAELWMGTHENGPSVVSSTGQSLQAYLKAYPQVLGSDLRSRFGDRGLPFLFKVLSVNKALSIQAHPNQALAKQLHADRPDIYKDPNHKPEMAIALTSFEALCGFRPLCEIQENLINYPELRSVVGPEMARRLESSTKSDYSEHLKTAFASLMNATRQTLEAPLATLQRRIEKKAYLEDIDELFLRLVSQYPGDVGCLVIYFVNYLRLEPGQAMFLGPNLIHAYLSGDCIECMACSDNVVRAGLTPKMIDVPTLCSMLEYKCVSVDRVKFAPSAESAITTLYDPPVPEFSVAGVRIVQKGNFVSLPARVNASIILVVRGEGKYKLDADDDAFDLKRGKVVFLPARMTMHIMSVGADDVVAFQAFS